MKLLFLVFVLISTVGGEEHDADYYADESITEVSTLIKANHFDPAKLSDLFKGINHTYLYITYSGGVSLTQGSVSGVAKMRRVGEVSAKGEKILEVTAHVGFDALQWKYDYHATIMYVGPWGTVSGTLKNLELKVVVQIDKSGSEPSARILSCEDFDTGYIGVEFTGGGLMMVANWFFNIASKAIVWLLQSYLFGWVRDIVFDQAKKYLLQVNDYFKQHPNEVVKQIAKIIEMMIKAAGR